MLLLFRAKKETMYLYNLRRETKLNFTETNVPFSYNRLWTMLTKIRLQITVCFNSTFQYETLTLCEVALMCRYQTSPSSFFCNGNAMLNHVEAADHRFQPAQFFHWCESSSTTSPLASVRYRRWILSCGRTRCGERWSCNRGVGQLPLSGCHARLCHSQLPRTCGEESSWERGWGSLFWRTSSSLQYPARRKQLSSMEFQ